MKYSLPVSVLAHLVLGASGLFVWTNAPRGSSETYVDVPLDIVSLADVTNIEEVVRPEPTPEPEPEDDLQSEEGEDEPVAQAEVTPQPEAEPEVEDVPPIEEPAEEEVPPTPDPTPEPEETAEPPPQDEPTRAPPVVQSREEPADPLADLLDGLDERLNQDVRNDNTRRQRAQTQTQELEDLDQEARRGAGARTANTATVTDFVKSHIEQSNCWRSTSDLPDWQNLDVTVSFRLDAEGRLTRGPEVIRSARPVNSDQYMRSAAQRALRAVTNCEPYPLPADQYELWQNEDINVTFNEEF
ncbi:hypothetical protein [Ponticaulis sp.]|uniref:hypothetical protein n=1 Tax=Ponticaulis sp. TaxID=2020902 RepID=UPI000B74608A|nr:hypothetical protein [Ponticaulis sp.]MAI90590.1 hypothetical protein [Ponticaulis sp.]OUX99104.1 MAG: hypothetical protein CBB65_09135 [Hyphomonadaceae bacterium TMED5]|tara:strand:+ start:111286 stop:112182 length:897 start_codon:yes stop_codon:yes gene_type:complete